MSNLPKGREDNFHHGNPDPKVFSSNSRRDEKEKLHSYDGSKNQTPAFGIKQFQ